MMSDEPLMGQWEMEAVKDGDKFTWIYRINSGGRKEYLGGSAGRIAIHVALEVMPYLNGKAEIELRAELQAAKYRALAAESIKDVMDELQKKVAELTDSCKQTRLERDNYAAQLTLVTKWKSEAEQRERDLREALEKILKELQDASLPPGRLSYWRGLFCDLKHLAHDALSAPTGEAGKGEV